MSNNIIKTTYTPTKNSEEEVCFWYPYIGDYFSPSAHVSSGLFRASSITRAYEEFKKGLDQRHSLASIKWVPVISEDCDTQTRVSYRGYTSYEGFGMDRKVTVVEPIIVRGKALPELTASYGQHSGRMFFSSTGYGDDGLTAGQRAKLLDWFDDQLVKATTNELFEKLKQQILDNAMKSIKKYAKEIDKEIKELEAFTL